LHYEHFQVDHTWIGEHFSAATLQSYNTLLKGQLEAATQKIALPEKENTLLKQNIAKLETELDVLSKGIKHRRDMDDCKPRMV
jgi:peptidoglycan hydrolase CwlO-like protein